VSCLRSPAARLASAPRAAAAGCDTTAAPDAAAAAAAAVLQEGERTISQRGQLTPEQKQRRVVLKRVNLDRSGVR
jgi:hypothetical protein